MFVYLDENDKTLRIYFCVAKVMDPVRRGGEREDIFPVIISSNR